MEEGRSAFKILRNMRNWFDSTQDRGLLVSPCECSIEFLGSISHGVSLVKTVEWMHLNHKHCLQPNFCFFLVTIFSVNFSSFPVVLKNLYMCFYITCAIILIREKIKISVCDRMKVGWQALVTWWTVSSVYFMLLGDQIDSRVTVMSFKVSLFIPGSESI